MESPALPQFFHMVQVVLHSFGRIASTRALHLRSPPAISVALCIITCIFSDLFSTQRQAKKPNNYYARARAHARRARRGRGFLIPLADKRTSRKLRERSIS